MIRKNILILFHRRRAKQGTNLETNPAASSAGSTAPVALLPCHLCDPEAEKAAGRVTLEQYGSQQHDLLVRQLVSSLPGIDINGTFCIECLEKTERELHARQLSHHQGDPLFIDLELGDHPILPTPARMGSNPYYRGRGVTIALVDSGFYPHDDLVFPSNRILAVY